MKSWTLLLSCTWCFKVTKKSLVKFICCLMDPNLNPTSCTKSPSTLRTLEMWVVWWTSQFPLHGRVRGPHCQTIIIFSSKKLLNHSTPTSRERNHRSIELDSRQQKHACERLYYSTDFPGSEPFFSFFFKGDGVFLLFHLASKNAVRYLNFMVTALSVYAMVISSIFSACKTRH